MSAKFSVIMHTIRKDVSELPNSILGMMIEAMMCQEYRGEFELIIVDLLYHQRKEQFGEILNNTKCRDKFDVLYIPEKSNPFKEKRVLRVSTPKNTGLIFARNEFIVATDDCQVLHPDSLTMLSEWAEQGHGAIMCYEKRRWEKGEGGAISRGTDGREVALGVAPGTNKLLPAGHIGFLGGTMAMLPVEIFIRVNGWDEMFDGSRQFGDGEIIERISRTGIKMAFENRQKVIEYNCWKSHNIGYDPGLVDAKRLYTKCNYPYYKYVSSLQRVMANTGEHREEAIKRMPNPTCNRFVDNKCSPNMHLCPWSMKYDELLDIFMDNRLVFDIKKVRESTGWENAVEFCENWGGTVE